MKAILAYRPALSSAIGSFIEGKASSVDPSITWNADFLGRLRPFATTGKLLRGCLVCFSYAAFSGKRPSKAVLRAAMALELAHSALLVHDDVMDKDELRRGQPSMHYQYQSLATRRGLAGASGFGENIAVCGGDMALFLAFELLAEAKAEPAISKRLNLLFARELAKVCGGQMQDIYLEASPAMPAKRTIYGLMRAKTAGYSLGLPLAMGAMLAGQAPATIRQLQAIGAAAGTIFQIRDDELGTMGTAAALGKPIGSDIKKGKKTLLYYHLFKRCDAADTARLKKVFGNAKASLQDISYVQAIIKRYGIPALLNQEVGRLQAEAFARIKGLALNSQAETSLKGLVVFCATRQA